MGGRAVHLRRILARERATAVASENAAVYVAQIDDERLAAVMGNPRYLEATREVLQKHGKLWFLNESYVIWRNRFER